MSINSRRKKIFIFIVFISILITLFIPGKIWAQENSEGVPAEETPEKIPDELTAEVGFDEIINYGIIGTSFTFNVNLTFNGEKEKYFKFDSQLPEGWYIEVQPQYEEKIITALKLRPGKADSIKVIVRPKVLQDPGEYDTAFTIKSSEEGDDLQATITLKAIVKEVGDLEFTTQTGRFNTEVVKGTDNNFVLILNNVGSGPVYDVKLSVPNVPNRWLVDFKEDTIKTIEAGQSANVEMNIIPTENTIAGDYEIRILAQSEKSSTFTDIRTTIKVPLNWQIVGIAIIVIVIGAMAVLFYRLGKR